MNYSPQQNVFHYEQKYLVEEEEEEEEDDHNDNNLNDNNNDDNGEEAEGGGEIWQNMTSWIKRKENLICIFGSKLNDVDSWVSINDRLFVYSQPIKCTWGWKDIIDFKNHPWKANLYMMSRKWVEGDYL